MASLPTTIETYAVEDGIALPIDVSHSSRELALVPKPDAASTAIVQRVVGKPFGKGRSGNPAGRKPGSRNRISELFITAMRSDFLEHGPSAIAALRERDPGAYLAAIRSMIPAHTIAEDADKLPAVNDADLTDAEWADLTDADGNPAESAMRQARRNRAIELVLDGRAVSVRDALRLMGAAL